MYTFDLIHKLRKCNNRLFLDTNHEVSAFGYEEFPVSGLYITEHNGTKYLFGVPHGYVPEYSICAINMNEMLQDGQESMIRDALNGIPQYDKERLIWRGWRAIVGNLIRSGHITKDKASKVFNTYFEPERNQLPRHYINKEI